MTEHTEQESPAGPRYSRVLIKLSGEAFAGPDPFGIDAETLRFIAGEIRDAMASGVQVAVVVGGGNIVRGAAFEDRGMDRGRADYMGMLGTVINGLGLQDALERLGVTSRVQTAIHMGQIAEPYIPLRAIRHLEKGRVVIFAAGLGSPYFSTDTAAAQRALEVKAQAVMKATQVDGVYDDDPRTNSSATMYRDLDYATVLADQLKVADATAISLCMDNRMPIVVFNLLRDGNIAAAVAGERIGTLIS